MPIYYTTSPLINPNDSHAGFWILMMVCAWLAWGTIKCALARNWKLSARFSGCFWGLLCTSFYFSFLYEYPTPLNEPVNAILVDEYTFSANDGPKSRRQDHSRVVYRVPEGEVAFHRGVGIVYPQQGVLYRQRVK
jgi:hypothetical protein